MDTLRRDRSWLTSRCFELLPGFIQIGAGQMQRGSVVGDLVRSLLVHLVEDWLVLRSGVLVRESKGRLGRQQVDLDLLVKVAGLVHVRKQVLVQLDRLGVLVIRIKLQDKNKTA